METTRRAPIWSLPPSLGLSPAATHLPTGPAFRWARFHPEQAWSPRSSRGCGGFWTPGELEEGSARDSWHGMAEFWGCKTSQPLVERRETGPAKEGDLL